ncbi:hypothetical protein ACFWIB_00085 [Streptomyces sp. NPDC127051]|uniref:hypothetical protein n=1 Tax=Streptomyces sp. NPDC127051 TaxID=3347119 RepID=UPI003665A810
MANSGGGGEGAGLPSVRIGDVRGSAFSIGGTDVGNSTVNHGGTGTDAGAAGPTAQELLEAVRDLRAALVRLPRSDGRVALDAELDAAAEELESATGGEEVRPGLPARLRGALERWAPLVDSVSAATALAALLTSFGG